MSDELEENKDLSFLSTPLLNSTIASNDGESHNGDNLNSSMTHQYITERLIKKITRQDNLWMIKKLDLTLSEKGSYIKKIKRIENLDGLVQLEQLSLSHNVIEKIENVSHLKCLRVLNLSYNSIQKIESISSLTNLETLNLSHNNISQLPYRLFKQLQRIKKLDVSHNDIAEFSTQIKQIRDLRLLGNLQDFSFNDNPVLTENPHAMDTAVFYLRHLQLLNGSPVTADMRAAADNRYQQDEVNALQDVILGKTRMIDAVSKEREEVVKALEEKNSIEQKLRRSGNTSMLRISGLEEELSNTKKILEQRTNELTAACFKHYALEQELSMYKVDARFRDIGLPPDVMDTALNEYVEESGYVSKAPLYPVQYDMRIPGHSENIEHYKDNDYTEPIPDDGRTDLLEQQIRDKERDKRKLEKRLAELEKELQDKQQSLDETQKRLDEIEKQLAEEKKLRDEMDIEMELKNEELEHLRDVEKRLKDAEAEVDDLHASLNSKARDVKDLRNALTMTNATGMELEHMKARLKKKEEELEKERAAHEEARRGFQEKQRELQRRASQLSKSASEADMLRAERDALLDKLDDLQGQLREGDEERADLEGELDRVKRDQNKLRRDASFVHKMFEDKETETEVLVGELDRTRDVVNALQDENRELKDQAIQALSESLRPENEILHRTLDELEKAQAENARLMRERRGSSPNLAREALRLSRDRVADLEDENAELRDILRGTHGNTLDPEDLARRVLGFLEGRLPKYTDSQPVKESLDLLPIIKLLLEERDKRREPVINNQNPQDLIRLLEDLIKDRTRQSPQPQQLPIINVNVPEQSSPRRSADDTILSERYLRASSPLRASTPGPTKVYIREEVEYDPEVIHLISRRAQTDRQTDGQNETININIKEKKNKRKRVVITNDSESSVDDVPDVLVLDKRRDKATNTNVHVLAEEMLNKFEKSTQMRDDREREEEKRRRRR
ncbi:centriolin-like isoform X2 [Bolinopsis microptera]|uniref:centriolin-like isoform X2 n=1 Tax=Bolinopsis microptera TaxID=2820187 RepID=UPI003079D1CE